MAAVKKRRVNSSIKTTICLFIVGVCIFLLQFIKIYLSFSGAIPDGSVLGFDVDSSERIYIGTIDQINVYHNGTLQRKISPPTSRTYRFYIENDKLIIGCVPDGKGGTYDLEGNELSYGEFSYDEIEQVAKHKKVVVNGHEYQLSSNLGITPYIITRDGIEVYQMSTIDYFFNGLPYWSIWICLSLAAVFLILLKVSDLQK